MHYLCDDGTRCTALACMSKVVDANRICLTDVFSSRFEYHVYAFHRLKLDTAAVLHECVDYTDLCVYTQGLP